jgi:hypothetical protein
MELETITLSKISQTNKDKYCMFSVMCEMRIKKKYLNIVEILLRSSKRIGGDIQSSLFAGLETS